jgi:hypothetical protein
MKPLAATSQALIIKHTPSQITISRAQSAWPLLVQNAEPNLRPYIHPIIAPDGNGTMTENAPPHHPWQHGLYVGLNDVSGVGYWVEGPQDGTFHPRPLQAPEVEGTQCRWSVTSEWRAPSGRVQLEETQNWTLNDRGADYELDVEWSLTAREDLLFGASAYGGLFIRMPFVSGGTVLTSEGHSSPAEAEARRARWVAIAMPLPDRLHADPIAGVAMMDHPGNPEHPTPWRVDEQLGIAPSRSILGPWTLPAGEVTTSRYRLFIHTAASDLASIEASWSRFVQG